MVILWELTSPNSSSWWKYFSLTYNLPRFDDVSKIALFVVKLSIKVSLVLLAGLTRTKNQNPRPLSNLFWYHESSGGLKITKQVMVERHIFRGKPLLRHFGCNFGLFTFGDLFWISSIPRDFFLMSRIYFVLKSLVWLTGENYTFRTILRLRLEILIRSLGAAMSVRRVPLDFCER